MPGAGHGSTMEDYKGNLWHAATMRISVNHDFERRVGIWKAAYDEEGELCCNQRYGDWPIGVSDGKEQDIWENPHWMLLSYGGENDKHHHVRMGMHHSLQRMKMRKTGGRLRHPTGKNG